jgi:hypothetical protein
MAVTVLDEEHRANNERVIKEQAPVAQKMNGQTADFGQQALQGRRLRIRSLLWS